MKMSSLNFVLITLLTYSIMRIRNSSNFILTTADVEAGGGVSMTVPDEAMSIRDILDRFSRGMDPSVSREGVYSPDSVDDDFPDLEKLRDSDLVDREEYSQTLSSANERTKADLDATLSKQAATKAAAKVKEAERIAALDKLIDKDNKRSAADDKTA